MIHSDGKPTISNMILRRERERVPLIDDVARIAHAFDPDRIARTFSPMLASAAQREARTNRFNPNRKVH